MAQDGNPDRDKAKRQRIYTHTPVFTITTVEGKDTQMGPEIRFSRVINAPAGLAQQVERVPQPVSPPTPSPADKQQAKRSAVNGNGDGKAPDTADSPPTDAQHWRREAATAVDSLMFDTAVSRLEPWFKDAAASFRDVLFPEWNPDKSLLYMKALLRYAEVRKTLDGRYPTKAAHDKAKVEALNTFNRLSAEKDGEE